MAAKVNGVSGRRAFLAAAAGAVLGAAAWAAPRPARIAITLDLEMSAQYPRRDMLEWNYQKGNLDEPTKQYAVEAARIVKSYGGVLHFFCVGQVLEQPDVNWLKDIAAAGHPIGNHTYDHISLKATRREDLQFRFQRAPWLLRNLTVPEAIIDNIRLTTIGLKERAGITVNGFRTPGGFGNGLTDRPDLQRLLLDLGFTWISSKYPSHQSGKPREAPGDAVYADIVRAQAEAQPFVYPSGLVEIPMSPISDVTAFRSHYWKLEYFLKAIRAAVTSVIARGGVFDFLAHPSCLVVEDPRFETIRLICELVKQAGDRAAVVDLGQIAREVPRPS